MALGRQIGQSSKQNEAVAVRTRSFERRRICANGLKPSRGGPAANLARLQAEYPGVYPQKLLRTLQRRLKTWRSEQANALLFGPSQVPPLALDVVAPNNGGLAQ